MTGSPRLAWIGAQHPLRAHALVAIDEAAGKMDALERDLVGGDALGVELVGIDRQRAGGRAGDECRAERVGRGRTGLNRWQARRGLGSGTLDEETRFFGRFFFELTEPLLIRGELSRDGLCGRRRGEDCWRDGIFEGSDPRAKS